MNRRYRLTNSSDFQRVRRTGTSHAHPLAILIVSPGDVPETRFGFTAGRSVGNAVQRNRAKRLLREAIRHYQADIRAGWDVVLIARAPLLAAGWLDIQSGIGQLLRKSGLIDD
jgi:ribonuclease P protein component